MATLDNVPSGALQNWLDYADEKESITSLMVAIGYDNGVAVEDLADWYGLSTDEVESVIEGVESRPLVLSVAEWEGIDFDALAESWGLQRETLLEWFEALSSRPVEESAEIIHRYSQRDTSPLLSHPRATVDFLDYQVIEEQGWDLDDDDLFEKASDAGLSSPEFGRFVVEPEETILEAVENRGYSWPYACRGGACANCAVIVKEGDIAMPGQTVLTDEQVRDMNARLACVGVPVTEELKVVMNVQHLDQFEDLRLPSPLSDSELSI